MAGLAICMTLANCSDMTGTPTVSPAPDKPWAADGQSAGDFSVKGPDGAFEPTNALQSGKVLTLEELIDIGQRNHPATRVAWQQARQAAEAVGMVEGTYLPIITANVIGGYQDLVTPVTGLNGDTDYIRTNSQGVVPNIALQWLLFDFGERQAWRDAAQRTAYAANVNFNGTHQALIYNISRSYFNYGAAQQDLAIARRALQNSLELQEAADGRYASGLGTTIETAQAKQLVAQSKFRLVAAEDGLSSAYQDLMGSIGVSPRSKLRIASSAGRRLPRARSLPTEKVIEQALARRPDVLASYAALQASEANVEAADAAFRPKVYLGAVAAANNGRIQTGTLPGADFQNTTSGVVVGMSIPIYDGRIRERRRNQAEAAKAAAAATHELTINTARSEIVVAANTLQSALSSYEAARELNIAADTTYEAAFEAFRNGLGTLTDVSTAKAGLLDSELAQVDAHAASLVAASTLAFALGNMTSRTAPAKATN
tara:strand:+ start:1645 stop:3102 length:1458 start_codon:yes stop_codon:yes gene_type:complete